MTTPSERRDTVQVLVRRGISQRKAFGYLGLSRRIASYAPRQAGKDQVVAERLLARVAEGAAVRPSPGPGWAWARPGCGVCCGSWV